MNEWMPIESAPKDGTKIDLWVISVKSDNWVGGAGTAGGRMPDAKWEDGRWQVYDQSAEYGDGGLVDVEDAGWWGSDSATHWMPLPPPPSTPKQGEGEWRYVEDASVPGGYRLKLISEDAP